MWTPFKTVTFGGTRIPGKFCKLQVTFFSPITWNVSKCLFTHSPITFFNQITNHTLSTIKIKSPKQNMQQPMFALLPHAYLFRPRLSVWISIGQFFGLQRCDTSVSCKHSWLLFGCCPVGNLWNSYKPSQILHFLLHAQCIREIQFRNNQQIVDFILAILIVAVCRNLLVNPCINLW